MNRGAEPIHEEDDLSSLLAHVPALIGRFKLVDGVWKALIVSGNLAEYGYTVQDFTGRGLSWGDLIHPEDRMQVMTTLEMYEEKGIHSFRLYYRFLKASGKYVYVTEYDTANCGADGKVETYDKAIVGETQEKNHGLLLDDFHRQQNVLNGILFRLTSSDIDNALPIILDLTGSCLDASRAMLFRKNSSRKNYTIEYEWRNQGIDPCPDGGGAMQQIQDIPEIYSVLCKTGQLIAHGNAVPEEFRAYHESRGMLASAYFSIYMNGMLYGYFCISDHVIGRVWDDNTVRFLKHIANIISEVLSRQHAGAQLEQSRRSFEAVLNNVDSYIFVIEPATSRILFANKAFRDTFGEKCIGKYIDSYIPLAGMDLFFGEDTANSTYAEVFCEVSGEWLSLSGEVITWIDGQEARLVNCYDITGQKNAANSLAAASKAKSDFIAQTSHEIRTPMNAILGLAELVLRESASDEIHSHAAAIKQAGRSLLAIVNDILDFSKIESGKMEIVPVRYRLSSLVHDVISIIRMRLLGSSLCFMVNVDSRLPEELLGDEVRIRQILLNVLGNAAKYTRKGYIRFELSGRYDEESGRYFLEYVVADTGRGIRPGDLGKLFTDYVQLDRHVARGIESTGLGLSISKKLCQAMGGEISVESVYGVGSTFRVIIPQQHLSDAPLASVRNAETKRVLIYDERPWYSDSVLHSCRNLGVDTVLARTADDFSQTLENIVRPITHVLVSPQLFASAQNALARSGKNSTFVILADLEKPDISNVRTLPMPVQGMSIANMLNDVREAGTTGIFTSFFTAPKARVLIVDDNETNLVVAKGLMRPYRMQLDTCLSAREALEKLATWEYDLLFIDHMMPEMDGLELIADIRDDNGPFKHLKGIPAVALTANALSGMREMYLSRGFDEFLSKPIEVARLDEVLFKLLPADKREAAVFEESHDGALTQLPVHVDGLNVKVGIANAGGRPDMYKKVLETFCLGTVKVIGKIETARAARDVALFSIHVHALKSALATIGAESLSAQAASLESQCKSGKMDMAASMLDSFLNGLLTLLDSTSQALSSLEPETNRKKTGDGALLLQELDRLEVQCINRDITEAEATLDGLLSYAWEGGIGQMLDRISKQLRLFDFEHALVGLVTLRGLLAPVTSIKQ